MSYVGSSSFLLYLRVSDAAFLDYLNRSISARERALSDLIQYTYTHQSEVLGENAQHDAAVSYALRINNIPINQGLAPMLAQQMGIADAKRGTWLRLTPVFWLTSREHIALQTFTEAELDTADWQAILAGISPVLAEFGWAVFASGNHAFLRSELDVDYHAPSWELAQHSTLNHALPSGQDAPRWQRAHTQLQMMLHTHPVNQARQARGLRPINALWLDEQARADAGSHEDAHACAQAWQLARSIPVLDESMGAADLNHILTPWVAQLRQSAAARLTVLCDEPEATAHHFVWQRPSLMHRVQRLWQGRSEQRPLDWLNHVFHND